MILERNKDIESDRGIVRGCCQMELVYITETRYVRSLGNESVKLVSVDYGK